MISPNANNDTPSLPPTNDANASFSTENNAYISIWNQVMNSPYKQVEFTTILLVLNNLCNSSSSALNNSNADLFFTLPPVSTSPPLDLVPFHSSNLILNGHDPTTSSYPWAGSLLFPSPHSADQHLAASSSLSANISYNPSSSPDNQNLGNSATMSTLSSSIELVLQPLGPLAGQALPQAPPPTYPSLLLALDAPLLSPFLPPFSQNLLIVKLSILLLVQPAGPALQVLLPLPSPSLFSGQALMWTQNNYTDGGKVSNGLSLPTIGKNNVPFSTSISDFNEGFNSYPCTVHQPSMDACFSSHLAYSILWHPYIIPAFNCS